jgi:hypothetical protein
MLPYTCCLKLMSLYQTLLCLLLPGVQLVTSVALWGFMGVDSS